jgi:predicted AAA+ superfamily ATPase
MRPATNRDTYLRRVLEVSPLLEDKSVFLFGPRQTGKTSYIANQLSEPPALVYNLLDRGLLLRLMADPTAMRQEILARNLRSSLVCIDEVQKLPELLDEVHLLIEERRIRFLLTGSSARKLRRSGTNLLGGRGRDRVMHPFVYPEVRDHGFSLDRMMYAGLLPPHFLSRNPDEDLAAYVDRYLTEEIAAEGAARNLPAFARFLQTAATMNTRMVNYTNVANDAQVPRQTVQQWFQILQDTLVAFELGPFTKTVKRKAISTSKLYFFDPGVVRSLRRLPRISPTSADFGEFFEHFIVLEVRAWVDYRSPRTSLHYWRSTSGYEVDLVLAGSVAIEVKATERPQEQDLRSLRAISEEKGIRRAILVCRESRPRMADGIEVMPWTAFLDMVWADKLL